MNDRDERRGEPGESSFGAGRDSGMMLVMVERETAAESPLDAAITEARATWPHVQVSREKVTAFVKERCGSGDMPLDRGRISELYLACACLNGDPEAWRSFDRAYLSQVPSYVARIDRTPGF